MADFQQCSDRTKRRRIAANVSKLLEEFKNLGDQSVSEIDSSIVTTENSTVEAPVEHELEIFESHVNDGSDLDNAEDGISDLENCSTGLNEVIESDVESNLDCNDWEARKNLFGDTDDDEDVGCEDSSRIQENLREWALTHRITHSALSDLLSVLQSSHPDLPKDARTLLSTKRSFETKCIAGGEYYYFGIQYWLCKLCGTIPKQSDTDLLKIHINIDGIPLFNSCSTSLWPILGSLNESPNSPPFPIAVFCSPRKPSSIDDYLNDFISEAKYLEENGFEFQSKRYKGMPDAIICDAPARALVKCVKPHSGYYSCERCMQKGEWCNKIILPNLEAPLITDEMFDHGQYKEHHLGISPFQQLSCGMVSSFPLDYMHLVCLGVMRRLLNLWIHGPRATKLSQLQVTTISNKLAILRHHIPREFSRKPRSLSEYKQWKATELQQFLLYTGPVVLKGVLGHELYCNFMDLSISIRLLLSKTLLDHYLDYSKQLLTYFVSSFGNLYGSSQLVYNVHSLIHLPDDAQRYGILDNVSAFKYENYLGKLKKLVRRPQNPVAQIVRRIMEGHCQTDKEHVNMRSGLLKMPHNDGPMPIVHRHCLQFKQYHGPIYFIATSQGNNCVQVEDKIGLVTNILQDPMSNEENNVMILFEAYENCESFFMEPLDSKSLSIFFVTKQSGIKVIFPITSISAKCLSLPYKSGFVVFPQMHFA